MRHMSDNEIVRTYNEARNKKTQIKILSDLNLCSYNDIVDILNKYGIKEEKKRMRKTVANKDEKAAVETNTKKEKVKVNKSEENKAAVEITTDDPVEKVLNESPKMEPIEITVLPAIPHVVQDILTKRMIICQNAIDKNTQELKEISDFLGGFRNEVVD